MGQLQPTLFEMGHPDLRPRKFDGETFNLNLDGERLATLLWRVRQFMVDGQWRTLAAIKLACGGSEASCSARLRDLRKLRFGGHKIERRRIAEGLWEYRMVT